MDGARRRGWRVVIADGLFALVLAGVLGIPTVWLLVTPGTEPVVGAAPGTRGLWLPVAITAVVVAHLAVGLRRLVPGMVFAVVVVVVAALSVLSVFWFLPTTLVVLVAIYSLCAHGGLRGPLVAGVVVAAGTPVVVIAGFLVAGVPGGPAEWLIHTTVRLGPFLVAAWGWGMFRRTRIAYLAALEERARRAEREQQQRARMAVLEERTRIAREMHDVVAHALSVMVSQADGGRYAIRAEPHLADETLQTIGVAGREALADISGVLAALREPEPSAAFPTSALAEVAVLADRMAAAGVPVEICGRDLLEAHDLTPAGETAAFRVAQEALTNVIKHAGAGATARLGLQVDGAHLLLSIEDDGAGGQHSRQPGGPEGTGLAGMHDRVDAVGGSLSTGPRPDGGFAVTARLPHAGSHW